MSENMIFCKGLGPCESNGIGYQQNYMAWNKQVTKDRYEQIVAEVKRILSDFTLDAREDWTVAWQKVRQSQWQKLAKIPEFDLEITKSITGLSKIEVIEEETLEIQGRKFRKSDVEKALNSIVPL